MIEPHLQDAVETGVGPIPHRTPAVQRPEDVPRPLPVLLLARDPPEVEQALHGLRPQEVMRILQASFQSLSCESADTNLGQSRKWYPAKSQIRLVARQGSS